MRKISFLYGKTENSNFAYKNRKNPDKIRVFLWLHLFCSPLMVEEGGFEPPKSLTADLQSAPFGRSGTLPSYSVWLRVHKKWSWWTDSNPRPADYKSAALPTELHQQLSTRDIIYHIKTIMSRLFFKFF